MLDVAQVKLQLNKLLQDFKLQVEAVYQTSVMPNWDSGASWHRMPHILYGCMMWSFAFIDLLSGYWTGTTSQHGQTDRMLGFIERYLKKPRREASIAIKMWRHKLMHTALPRILRDSNTGKSYSYLLHWADQLQIGQHFTLSPNIEGENLNLSLFFLIDDIKLGLERYLDDLAKDPDLQNNYARAQQELDSSPL